MKLSTERILTTHVGSLPRTSKALDVLYKKENGEPYDPAAFDSAVSATVLEVGPGYLDLALARPVRAVTPGQSGVLFDAAERVLGGGVIG